MNKDSSYSRDYILVSCVFHFFFYKEKPAYLFEKNRFVSKVFRFDYECNCLIIHELFVGFY